MKELFYNIISALALSVSCVPLLIVIFRKLTKDIPLLFFSLYWLVGGIINATGFLPFVSNNVYAVISVVYNILDVPFVLYIFYLNTTLETTRRVIKFLLPVYLLIEILNGFIRGFTDDSFKYFLGAGVIIILVAVMHEIIAYFQQVQHSNRRKAITILYFALLFEYATYIICFIFTYVYASDGSGKYLTDINIVYHTSSLLSVAIASVGFLSRNLNTAPEPKPKRVNEVLIRIID